MKELIDTIFNSSRERVKNPLIGSFVLALIGFNWKAIFILLFSDSPAVEKINLITKDYSSITNTVLLPLVFAAFYVAGLPYVMWFFDRISSKSWRGRRTHLSEQKIFEIRSQKSVTKEQIELEDAIARQRDTEQLNQQITDLTHQLRQSEEENKKLNESIKDYESNFGNNVVHELTDKQKGKYDMDYIEFKKSELFGYFHNLGLSVSKGNGVPNHMGDLIVQKFTSYQKLIEVTPGRPNTRDNFTFTKKGEYFWEKYLADVSVNNGEISINEDSSDGLPF